MFNANAGATLARDFDLAQRFLPGATYYDQGYFVSSTVIDSSAVGTLSAGLPGMYFQSYDLTTKQPLTQAQVNARYDGAVPSPTDAARVSPVNPVDGIQPVAPSTPPELIDPRAPTGSVEPVTSGTATILPGQQSTLPFRTGLPPAPVETSPSWMLFLVVGVVAWYLFRSADI